MWSLTMPMMSPPGAARQWVSGSKRLYGTCGSVTSRGGFVVYFIIRVTPIQHGLLKKMQLTLDPKSLFSSARIPVR
jgi:hypothetical protein